MLPLRREHAEEAITLPALLRDPERPFRSRPFGYDEAALAVLLDYFTKNGTEDVESFQLQIVCRAIELQVIERRQRIVTPDLFGDQTGLNRIIRDFYTAEIGQPPTAEQQAVARELLEEQFITESGRRRSVAEDDLLIHPGATRDLLDMLVAARLLRREPRLRTFYYEISHDTLVEPILEKYRERKQEEEAYAEAARLEAERLEMIRQREAAEELARSEAAKRRKVEQQRQQARLLAAAAIVGFILAIGVGFWAFAQKKEADVARIEADAARIEADAARIESEHQREATQKALDQFLAEKKQREKLATDELLRIVETLQESGNTGIALRRLEEALKNGNEDPRIKQKMNELKHR